MTWIDVPDGSPFTADALPYGVFSTGGRRRVGVAIGAAVIDLAPMLDDDVFAAPALDGFLASGRGKWRTTRERLLDLVHGRAPSDTRHVHQLEEVALHLPFTVADYIDFYASLHHATNAGRIFRPAGDPLPANWRHLPVGYHGRAGTVVVSGTPIVRPSGPLAADAFGPTRCLDFEAEVGFVIGTPSLPSSPLRAADFDDHVFGVVLVNDWSARDIQRWETVPLGPFLGKSFATSIAAWVLPLDALAADRQPAPRQDPPPLPYLVDTAATAMNMTLAVHLNGHLVSRPPFAGMYWTAGQMLSHLTVNGAGVRTGDLFASGTVSGAAPDTWGSLLELSSGGRDPVVVGGETRTYLSDGDTVAISGTTASGIPLPPVEGTVVPPPGGP